MISPWSLALHPLDDGPVDEDAERREGHGDDERAEQRVDAQVRPQGPAEVGGQDEERALRQVDDLHDPEGQRQPGRHQRVDAAGEHAEDQGLEQLSHPLPQAGLVSSTVLVVAAEAGATICRVPCCHWESSRLPSGSPALSHFSGPTIVLTVLPCSQLASALWLRLPTALTAACSDLAGGVGVGGVLGGRRAEHLRVRLHEALVARVGGGSAPGLRGEDAVGVGRAADRARVGLVGRRVGLEEDLRVVIELLQRPDELGAVVRDRSLDDHLRSRVGDGGGDGVEVRGARVVDLVVDGLDAERLPAWS